MDSSPKNDEKCKKKTVAHSDEAECFSQRDFYPKVVAVAPLIRL